MAHSLWTEPEDAHIQRDCVMEFYAFPPTSNDQTNDQYLSISPVIACAAASDSTRHVVELKDFMMCILKFTQAFR